MREATSVLGRGERAALASGWAAEARAEQRRVLDPTPTVLSSLAELGSGGLGRHAEELFSVLEEGDKAILLTRSAGRDMVRHVEVGPDSRAMVLAQSTLLRRSPAWRVFAANALFDRAAAAQAPAAAERVMAFNGQALAQFRSARSRGSETVLISANCHMRHVAERHAKAYTMFPFERPWGRGPVLRRNLEEYEASDTILVPSEYVRESFIAEGFDEGRLPLFPLTPLDRFVPDKTATRGSTFNVVYVGALTVDKGTPLLVEAFRRLPFADIRLHLVGGWSSSGMRKYLGQALAADRRMIASPGDPLLRLQAAGVYVQPSFQDAAPYSAAEALSCGVPVIVTEDTGTRDRVTAGVNGIVIPTGDLDALTGALEAAYATWGNPS